jgi:acetyl-CoA carboxylase carboxyl transferase subunit beta
MPEGLWLKCGSCARTIFKKEMEGRFRVCPDCGFHFTIGWERRVAITADEGSWEAFNEDLAPVDRLAFNADAPYEDKIARAQKKTGLKDAFVSGVARVGGQSCILGILDFSYMGGSMGIVVGEKVSLAAERAAEDGIPLVIFTSSGGARMHEGAFSLMQMAKTSAALSDYRNSGGFYVSVMSNPTTGGVTASFASIADVLIAEPGALIGFAGPRVIQETIKQELPKGFQRAEFLLEKGQVDAVVTREDLPGRLAFLFRLARPDSG